jgi:molybdopterin-guanine dinucleotide biosynthesis adapter protein
MKAVAITGITKSGKTTVAETLIRYFRGREYSVGSIKEIHFEQFAIDTPGTNTDRHRQAGSQLVTALGLNETDVLFPVKLDIKTLLSFYEQDYVVMEGVSDIIAPRIITAHNVEEIDERMDGCVFAISGRIAEKMTEYRGIPVIDCTKDPEKLCRLSEEKVFEALPNFSPKCCKACGFTCKQLCERILQGSSRREDCVLSDAKVELYFDGKKVNMVPFVQNVLRNAVLAVAGELDGYKNGAGIHVDIGREEPDA